MHAAVCFRNPPCPCPERGAGCGPGRKGVSKGRWRGALSDVTWHRECMSGLARGRGTCGQSVKSIGTETGPGWRFDLLLHTLLHFITTFFFFVVFFRCSLSIYMLRLAIAHWRENFNFLVQSLWRLLENLIFLSGRELLTARRVIVSPGFLQKSKGLVKAFYRRRTLVCWIVEISMRDTQAPRVYRSVWVLSVHGLFWKLPSSSMEPWSRPGGEGRGSVLVPVTMVPQSPAAHSFLQPASKADPVEALSDLSVCARQGRRISYPFT